jgi:hypothetical protein
MLTEIPPKEVLLPELMELVEAIMSIDKLSVVAVERAAAIPRGIISRMREGVGGNFDSVQRLNAWALSRKHEIETAGPVVVIKRGI